MDKQRRDSDPQPSEARAQARAEIPRAVFRGHAVADAGWDSEVRRGCDTYNTAAVRLWGPR